MNRLSTKCLTINKTPNNLTQDPSFIEPQKIGKKTRYYLGKNHPGVFLTSQEAKCMYYCIHNLTSKKIGVIMNIHFRTVEYYRDNIRCKVNADSKKELIEKIKQTDFVKYQPHLRKICQKIKKVYKKSMLD